MGAVPGDEQGNPVHYEHHNRHHKGHDPIGKELGLFKVLIGRIKTLFLIALSGKGSDHRYAGENFSGN